MIEQRYILNLSDGASWGFCAAPEIHGWLDALAKIMQLRRSTEPASHRLVLAPMGDGTAPPLDEPGPSSGWDVLKQGSVLRVWSHEECTDTVMELDEQFTDHPEIRYIDMWSALRVLHRHAVRGGGGPFHATLAELDGKGILIAASGDTGKSTCYRRFPAPWNPLCDDQVLIIHRGDGAYMVHPFPTWSDYLWRNSDNTWDCSHSVPIAALFFLEQADEDTVTPLPLGEATARTFKCSKEVWESHWNRLDDKKKRRQTEQVFLNGTDLVKNVPVFRLLATRHGRFWEEIEKVL